MTDPPTIGEIASRLRGTEDGAFFDRLLTVSVKELLVDLFESEQLQGALSHAHDVGDITAPGSAWCYAHIKTSGMNKSEDVGLVHGGMGGITRAMATSAQSVGVSIRTAAPVERILIEDGRALGVVLEGGEEIRSRVVLSTAGWTRDRVARLARR